MQGGELLAHPAVFAGMPHHIGTLGPPLVTPAAAEIRVWCKEGTSPSLHHAHFGSEPDGAQSSGSHTVSWGGYCLTVR